MKNTDLTEYELINYIMKATKKSKEEIRRLAEEKREKIGKSVITPIGSIRMVATDLKVEIDRNRKGVETSLASARQNHRLGEFLTSKTLIFEGLKRLDHHNFRQHISIKKKDLLIKKMEELTAVLKTVYEE